jgi:hypothetical protein
VFSIVVSVQFPMKNILYHVLLALPSLVSISRALVLTPDAILVRNQLGYLPPNYRQVSAWTEDGLLPVAIKTHPLNGGAPRRQRKAVGLGTPFPTLYWLTCPDISRAISDLERRGYVGILEGRINSSNEKKAQFLDCHKYYAKDRWSCLTAQEKTFLERDDSKRMRDMLQSSGIAGTNYTAGASVKCLHAQYAHYRSVPVEQGEPGFNPVGYWVHCLLLEQFPNTKL